ncbi:hypothetical protein CV102_25590 [Natronococcus pandeyae]|uniref:Uncharacterized protein n=1 Tax=Natronococcus pandeyae TaxID=2055836 RepID=A0A8J8TPF7_9EURY|nr:hypothetical protein [Natronococcus pandeyae]TYL35845.1 hypothetical protein CV102_25590 [Natronococcus pandeyae]
MSATTTTSADFNLSDYDSTDAKLTALTNELLAVKQENAELRDRVAELEETVEEHESNHETHGKNLAKTNARVAKLEEAGEQSPNESESPAGELYRPETPLEEVCAAPDTIANESLTANQQRARSFAADVTNYTKSVPAGRAIKSSELRRVLTAIEGKHVHTQTTDRVMKILDDLGKDGVKIRKGQDGERVVVFTDAIAERLKQTNGVVIGTRDQPPGQV